MNKAINPTVPITLTSCAVGLSLLMGLVPVLSLLVLPLLILALIFQCMLHHQLWSAIPEKFRSTTPGKAVGFLFIPFFNFYWVFPSFVGLTTSIEKATGKPSAQGLAVANAVLFILAFVIGWIPWVGVLFIIARFVVWLIFVRIVVKDVNAGILTVQSPPVISA